MAAQQYSIRQYAVSIAGLIWLAVVLSQAALTSFEAFAMKNPAVAAPIIAGISTVLGGVIAVTVGRYFERKKEIEAAHRQRQIEVFEGMTKTVMDIVLSKEVIMKLMAWS